jgi:hypothetical protein
VDRYLLYFRQWLIIHPLSALLLFQPLFIESSLGDQHLAHPLLWYTFSNSVPPLCVSFQFLVLFSFLGFIFLRGSRYQSAQGFTLIYLGVAVGIPQCDTLCSPAGLLNVSQTGLEPASGSAAALQLS